LDVTKGKKSYGLWEMESLNEVVLLMGLKPSRAECVESSSSLGCKVDPGSCFPRDINMQDYLRKLYI
jgi:hypothetical protein